MGPPYLVIGAVLGMGLGVSSVVQGSNEPALAPRQPPVADGLRFLRFFLRCGGGEDKEETQGHLKRAVSFIQQVHYTINTLKSQVKTCRTQVRWGLILLGFLAIFAAHYVRLPHYGVEKRRISGVFYRTKMCGKTAAVCGGNVRALGSGVKIVYSVL